MSSSNSQGNIIYRPNSVPDTPPADKIEQKSLDINVLPCRFHCKLCKICFVEEMNTALVPCGHVFACFKCAVPLSRCPVCHERKERLFVVYFE